MKYKLDVEEMKRNQVFDYFAKIKYDMEHDAIVKIKYQMKKFLLKMNRKRLEAEFKKASKKKPKTNKYGNPINRNKTVAAKPSA